MAPALDLAYLYPEHLGRPAARVLQVAATLRALGQEGARVAFLPGWFSGLADRLAELGLAGAAGVAVRPVAMCQPGPGLPLPFSWQGLYLAAARRRLEELGAGWVLVRHLKPADYLMGHWRRPGRRILYEAHELFAQTAREEGMPPARLGRLAALERRVLAGADRVRPSGAPLAADLAPLAGDRWRWPPRGGEDSSLARGPRRAGWCLRRRAGPLKGRCPPEALAGVPEARLEVLGGAPGSPDWRRLTELAARLGLGPRLVMRPRADQAAVRELLARARVAVWPGSGRQAIAARHTSPLKLFEYLAAGCAVVAPRVPAAASVLEEGREAAFTPDDPADLAAVLRGFWRAPWRRPLGAPPRAGPAPYWRARPRCSWAQAEAG